MPNFRRNQTFAKVSLLCCFAFLWVFAEMPGRAQSQLEINTAAAQDYAKTDAELNRVYKQIRTMYKSETLFLKRLQEAQQAWMAFRDAELEALYPTANKNDDKSSSYGSAYSLCRSNWLSTLTKQRTKELQRWLKGTQEGDVCCGSIKVK
jgi:uncharacterized protein YecT (DUF1311 family)